LSVAGFFNDACNYSFEKDIKIVFAVVDVIFGFVVVKIRQ